MQRKMYKEWNGSRSFFSQAFTHWLAFSLFPLSRRFFQSFAALRLGCCSSNIQTNCIHCRFILTYPWASIVLHPTQCCCLPLSFFPTVSWEHSSPCGFFLPALLVSILDLLENPLQLWSISKDWSVQWELYNISAFLVVGVGGYIPCYHESEVLQGKVRRHGWVLAGAIAQGTVSLLMPYHLKISNVFVVFLLGHHSAQLCQVCWLRETCG